MSLRQFFKFQKLPIPVMRLGLATRGNTHLRKDDILHAFEQGVNYWNWCGCLDGMSEAVAELGLRRQKVAVAAQLEARHGEGAKRELQALLDRLKSDYLDVVMLYYVETADEWQEILRPRGALEFLQGARAARSGADDRAHDTPTTTRGRDLAGASVGPADGAL